MTMRAQIDINKGESTCLHKLERMLKEALNLDPRRYYNYITSSNLLSPELAVSFALGLGRC